MPTLKTLFSAPVTSPLNEVDVEDVGLFLIQLTARGFLQSKEIQENHATCHDSMAYAICNQIIAQPMSFHVKILLKLLTSLQISDDDFSKLKELKALQTQMVGFNFTAVFFLYYYSLVKNYFLCLHSINCRWNWLKTNWLSKL